MCTIDVQNGFGLCAQAEIVLCRAVPRRLAGLHRTSVQYSVQHVHLQCMILQCRAETGWFTQDKCTTQCALCTMHDFAM